MPRKIFVVGHKNPDTDSIVSAVAYAELLHRQGMENVIPARQGEVWPETRYLLDRFGFPAPLMKLLRAEKGYASFLFMVVDVVHSQTEILIAGMEQEVAEALGERLTTPHSIVMGGIMSRKKQVVPILPRVARKWKGSRG
jgi:inorganic pyrophosphatase/exopolyphosphatase